MNLVNASVTYAVEDIVLGDLLNDKNVAFWWIDWQQGGSQGGMTGDKQNPTIWLAHLRCTDRHRVGDDTRAMVLARWGGMGHHRYQVGCNQKRWFTLVERQGCVVSLVPLFSAARVAAGGLLRGRRRADLVQLGLPALLLCHRCGTP